jgi:hypothetical protein
VTAYRRDGVSAYWRDGVSAYRRDGVWAELLVLESRGQIANGDVVSQR